MSEAVKILAGEQRKRLVASVMGQFERTVLPTIPREKRAAVKEEFRERVFAAANQYHDFVLDMARTLDQVEGVAMNDEFMRLLHEIRDGQRG